jgi:hypothetical protein
MSIRLALCVSASLGLVLLASGCNGKSDPGSTGGETDTDTGGITAGPTSADGGPAGPDGSGSNSADGGTASTSDGTATDGAAMEGSGTEGPATTGNDPNNPVDCGGDILACGNGMDDDGDGLIDLDDPECTGPCDDDEATFATGIPGDNMDCKQDCFFDGNSGQGDDGCNWDLRCDPANPGANIGCAYTGGNNCDNQPPNQDAECIMFCEQFVPAGCDCFGCCTVQTEMGPVDIFLNSGPDCALDNLAACETCTSQIADCGNPCVPEECQVCFGETEPPRGCDMPGCPGEQPSCTTTNDCPTDFYCLQNCCFPPPPG